jgi:hypothetical protein
LPYNGRDAVKISSPNGAGKVSGAGHNRARSTRNRGINDERHSSGKD